MTSVSIVLPTYNEQENIGSLIDTLTAQGDFEIIVVDDTSPDDTWKVVEEISAINDNVRLLKRESKLGLASAIYDGISLAQGDYILWMDSDFSMPPEVVPQMVEALGENDIVVASRYINGSRDARPFGRVATSWLLNVSARLLLSNTITDYTSGFIGARKEVFEHVKISPKGHGEYCISFLFDAKKAGFRIKEIPHTCIQRRHGKTKTFPNFMSVFRHAMFYPITIFKARFS